MDTQIAASPPSRRLLNKRFLLGVLFLLVSAVVIGFLFLRTQPIQIEITNPRAGESISVAAYKDSGKPTGDGTYTVEGNYSGELGRELKIYVLVRAANKPNESWWIQEDESEIVVVRKDRWFINGHWKQNVFFGRGKDSPEGPLKIGELWDIKAVIAARGQKGSIRPDQSMTTQAESQIVQVKIGNIVP